MNEVSLTRLVELARCIPRDYLSTSEEIFRQGRTLRELQQQLAKYSDSHVAFRDIANELNRHKESVADFILIVRSAILTRSRYAVHAPRAVCTVPDSCVPGMEDTLNESIKLIKSARFTIYLMNYWMTAGSIRLLNALMDQVEAVPSLKVVIIGDSKKRFLEPFNRMWKPEVTKPTIYIYKPGLETASDDRSKMHAKTLVIDETRMLITSANMTGLAMNENIEVGISLEAPRAVRKISHMINELIHRKDLFERV